MSARRGRAGVVAVVILVVACGREPLLVTRPAGASRSLVVRNVRVFDAPAAALRDGRWDVVVREGRIAAIERPGAAAPGLPEIDGEGGTLVPGLVDVHTHTGSTANPPWQISLLPNVDATLAAFLYAGVTTVLDLGNLSPAVFGERERLANGAKLGPRLYAAGPVFTAPGGHPAEVLRAWLPWYLRWYVLPRATREVATAEDGRRAVAELLPQHPDILKLAIDAGARDDVPCLAPETIAAITAAGHAGGVRSIAHIGSSAEAVAALRGGVDALAHAPWREELSDQAVAAIAAAHVPVVVTLAIWDLIEGHARSESELLPIEREIAAPDLLARFADQHANPAPFQAALARAHDVRRRSFAALRRAGVTILAGSDACNPTDLPGAGLHLELTKLVEAGMTPAEALRAATADNARFLAGDDAPFGAIAVGKRADLVLVRGDPTADIRALGAIAAVVLDGALLQRHASH